MGATLIHHRDLLPLVEDLAAVRDAARRGAAGEPFLAEPDLLAPPGGLQDLWTMRWLAVACHRVAPEAVWSHLAARQLLPARTTEALAEAEAFLLALRTALEALAGGRVTRLGRREQARVAALWGRESPTALMTEVYQRLETVARAVERFTRATRGGRFAVGSGLVVARRTLGLADDDEFLTAPGHLVRAHQIARTYRFVFHDELRDAIDAWLCGDHAPAPDRDTHDRFLAVLRSDDVAETLDAMADTGVLAWCLPAWGALRRHLPADSRARLTPGETGLRCVAALEDCVAMSEHPARAVWERVEVPEAVRLALLLHGLPAEAASDAALTLGCDQEVAAIVAFLIARQQLLFEAAPAREPDDDALRVLCAAVPTPAYLDLLFLLTVARWIVLAESHFPEVTLEHLVALHRRARAILEPAARPDASPVRRLTASEMVVSDLPPGLIRQHLESMPASYLFNTPWQRLMGHIRAVARAREGQPVIDLDTHNTATELFICTRDEAQPGLLTSIAGTLYAHHVNIQAAQVYTRAEPSPLAIDTLWVDVAGKPLVTSKQQELSADLQTTLTGQRLVPALIEERGRALRPPVAVVSLTVRNVGSEEHTVVELIAADREGLLYRTAGALAAQGLNISAAKVTTWAGWARDAFYVTDTTGARVPDTDLERLAAVLRADLGTDDA